MRARTLLVHVVPGMVVPIVDLDGSATNIEANIMWDEVDGSFIYYPAGWWYDDRDTEHHITLPLDARPGMWAVQVPVHQPANPTAQGEDQ